MRRRWRKLLFAIFIQIIHQGNKRIFVFLFEVFKIITAIGLEEFFVIHVAFLTY